jgi:hypothetical protein
MTNKQTGGPAFPSGMIDPSTPDDAIQAIDKGMTLRDYFAAKAMQGMFANPDDSHENYDLDYDSYTKEISRCAYVMADAMLKAREQ